MFILVLPAPDKVKQLFSADVRDRILHVSGEFGNGASYNVVNQNIADKLSSLEQRKDLRGRKFDAPEIKIDFSISKAK